MSERSCHHRLPHFIWLRDLPCCLAADRMRLEVKPSAYLRAAGLCSRERFIELNPEWPLRAWLGTVLEWVKNGERAG